MTAQWLATNRPLLRLRSRADEAHGRLPYAGVRATPHLARPCAQPCRTAALSRYRHPRRRRNALDRVPRLHARFQRRHVGPHVRGGEAARTPAVEPAAPRGRRAGPGLEHCRLVHHEHQLAGVHARNDDELLHPDVRAGDAQLLVRGRRARAGSRVYPRHRAQGDEDARQLLGRPDARNPVGAAAHLGRVCASRW